MALWDKNMEEHWWRVIKYLDLLAKNGIILSPNKFQLSSHEIDFAGFRVTDHKVKPMPKYLDAIRNFPRPTNISDVRSWFGLVNQVAHYAKLVEMMKPFKHMLSSRVKFMWNDELEQAFEESSTRKGRRRCAPTRDVTRVGETIAYSLLRRDLDDFGWSRPLVLVLQQQLA